MSRTPHPPGGQRAAAGAEPAMPVIAIRPLTAEQATAQAAWLLAGRDDEAHTWDVLWEALNPLPRPVACTRRPAVATSTQTRAARSAGTQPDRRACATAQRHMRGDPARREEEHAGHAPDPQKGLLT